MKKYRTELAWRIAYAIEFQSETECEAGAAMDAARACEYRVDHSPSVAVQDDLEATGEVTRVWCPKCQNDVYTDELCRYGRSCGLKQDFFNEK